VTRLTEGFKDFVTSIVAPVASGWSSCRVGLAPTGKRRLFTAHTQSGIALCREANCSGRPRSGLHAPVQRRTAHWNQLL